MDGRTHGLEDVQHAPWPAIKKDDISSSNCIGLSILSFAGASVASPDPRSIHDDKTEQ